MRFRTKPFEIEAEHFADEAHFWNIQAFVGARKVDEDHYINNFQWANTYHDWSDEDPAIIAEVYDHLHGTWVGVKAGQWIIKGAKGEFYPCDPEIFEAKYEAVDA